MYLERRKNFKPKFSEAVANHADVSKLSLSVSVRHVCTVVNASKREYFQFVHAN